MKYKYHQSLKRISNDEYIFESNGRRAYAEKTEQPRDSKQWKNDRGGLDTSFDLLELRLVLNVSCSHHLTNHQDKYYDIYLSKKKKKEKLYTLKMNSVWEVTILTQPLPTSLWLLHFVCWDCTKLKRERKGGVLLRPALHFNFHFKSPHEN